MQQQQNSSAMQPAAQMQSPRLDMATKAHINKLLRNAVNRTWCRKHGKQLPPPKLPPVVLRVIKEWFQLVDDDGSGTLEHHELLAALQAARIPCDACSITEMIKLMDANCDGCISWAEFEAYMMTEFAAGQQLLSGEFVLPSGTALPFGSMIRQLKRNQMLSDVTQGGEARTKWLHFDIDLTADAAELQQAEEAIRVQKEYNETLHLREQTPRQQQQQQQQQQYNGSPRLSVAAAAGARATQAAASGGASAGAAAAPAAGGGGAAASSPQQQPNRPAAVPRLQLASLSGSGGSEQQQQQQQQQSSARISSGGRKSLVGLLTERQTTALLSCLPGSLEHLVGSPRLGGVEGAAASMQPHSTAQHAATARSARGAADKYASLCSPARTAAVAAATASSSRTAKAAAPGSARGAAAAAAAPRAPGPRSCIGSDPLRPYSASSSTGNTSVRPQPSRDEWRAVAASCLTHRLSEHCRSPRVAGAAGGSSARTHRSSGSSKAATLPQAPSQQQQQPRGLAAAAGLHNVAAADAAAAAAPEQHPAGFSVRQWQHTGASPASSARRTQRSGGAAAAAAAAMSGGAAGVSRAMTARGCSSGSGSKAAVSGRPVRGVSKPQAAASSSAAAAATAAATAEELLPPASNDGTRPGQQPALSNRAGRAAAAAGVNSPRSAKHAAAAAAYGVAAGSGRSSKAASMPRQQHKWAASAATRAADLLPPCDTTSPRRQQQQQQQMLTCTLAPPAAQSVLDASCKYLLSACAVPPAALLSPHYRGPVEAAVASKAASRQHTPRPA